MSELNDWQIPVNGAELFETMFVPAISAVWAPKVIALAQPQPGEHVLDVACGTGALTRLIPAFVGPSGRVVGLDLNPAMLDVARERTVHQARAAQIEWSEGDAGILPFADATFDVVYCQLGLMFFPNRIVALQEMRRVLRPNGRLAVMTWGAIDKCPAQTVMKNMWGRHFGADKAAFFDAQHALSDPEEVLRLIRDAGFNDAFVQAVMGVIRFDSPELLTRIWGTVLGIQADAQTRAQIIAEASHALHVYVGAEGLVYPIEAILGSARK
jgi:ubiquinone/menaquinone biosynthesis C-methylase UbiE